MKKDETSAERRAAIIKRGAERERRDLFADRGLDLGAVKETVLPPPSPFAASVGARNENSVLFRVDQLGGGARGGAMSSPRTPTFSDTDDEGVIDLKALASSPPAARAIVPPLFSEPPPMTLEVASESIPVPRRPQSKLMTALVGVTAAAFVIVVGFGISVAFKGEEPVQHAAAAPAPAPPPPPPVTATPATPTTTPADLASAEEPKATSTAKAKPARKGAKGARGGKSGVATAKTSGPKAGDACGCHGDFTCILACTAKGK